MPTYTPLTVDRDLSFRPPAKLGDTNGVRTLRTDPQRLKESTESTAVASSATARPGKRLSAEDAIAVLEGRSVSVAAAPQVEEVRNGPEVTPQATPAVWEHAPASPPHDQGDLWPDPAPTFTYLAGAAGSGKTWATRAWAERESGLTLCATTGIAAINLGGETLNSVLGYFDTASLQEMWISGFLRARLGKLWKAGVRRLIVDEVSMLAGDQLTFLVKALDELNGQGYVLDSSEVDEESGPVGMGLTLVGDFAQLPPVKAPFAFESPEWDRFAAHTITLTEIRRQADPDFIDALRAARVGNGKRALDYFAATIGLQQETDDQFEGPTLLAKNDAVDRYNWLRLSRLSGADVHFTSSRWGKQRSEWGNPDKPPATWGIPERLHLKIGALVMVLANRRTTPLDKEERGELIYVNGDLGELVDAQQGVPHGTAQVRLQRTGEVVSVSPVERRVKIPCDSARRKELRAEGKDGLIDGKYEVVGGIVYLPLRLAYASTVHRSQGLSLDRVQINIRDAFWKTGGMLYVGLSRSRTAAGLRVVGSPAAFIERCAADVRVKGWL